jgi:hypothetical protein
MNIEKDLFDSSVAPELRTFLSAWIRGHAALNGLPEAAEPYSGALSQVKE